MAELLYLTLLDAAGGHNVVAHQCFSLNGGSGSHYNTSYIYSYRFCNNGCSVQPPKPAQTRTLKVKKLSRVITFLFTFLL